MYKQNQVVFLGRAALGMTLSAVFFSTLCCGPTAPQNSTTNAHPNQGVHPETVDSQEEEPAEPQPTSPAETLGKDPQSTPPPSTFTVSEPIETKTGLCQEVYRLQKLIAALPEGKRRELEKGAKISVTIDDPWGGQPSEEDQVIQTYRTLRWKVFRDAASLFDKRLKPSVSRLRTAAEELNCLGNYRPLESCKTGTKIEIAACKYRRKTIPDISAEKMSGMLRKQADTLEAALEAKARCDADPQCVQQREIDELTSSICFHMNELREVKERLRQRKADAVKHGVINVVEQHDDIEYKNDLVEVVAVDRTRYRDLAGKNFRIGECE